MPCWYTSIDGKLEFSQQVAVLLEYFLADQGCEPFLQEGGIDHSCCIGSVDGGDFGGQFF